MLKLLLYLRINLSYLKSVLLIQKRLNMKKIFFLIAVLFINISAFAIPWQKSMLRIKEEHGRAISVTIDGKRFNKIGRSLTVNDVSSGRHMIKIYRYNSNGHGYANGILVYQGNLTLKPSHIYYLTIANKALDIEENCCIDDYGHWNNNDTWDRYEDQDDNSWNNNNQWNNNPRDNYNENTWDAYTGVMSNGRFQLLLDQVRKASFESSKVNVAKQALRNNKITCDQLVSLLHEFSFESTKVQFAKDNYRNIVDKRNFFLINDVFTFQSSKDELTEFLNRQER